MNGAYNFKLFFVCVLTIKDRKHIEQNFHSAAGVWWVKNFSVGICDGAPSTAHSSFNLGFVLPKNRDYC